MGIGPTPLLLCPMRILLKYAIALAGAMEMLAFSSGD